MTDLFLQGNQENKRDVFSIDRNVTSETERLTLVIQRGQDMRGQRAAKEAGAISSFYVRQAGVCVIYI